VSGALRLVQSEGEDWRAQLGAAIRPEFGGEVYVARPGDPWLFGEACAVAECSAPAFRPIDGRGGTYVCSGHHQNYRQHGRADPSAWLAGAGPLQTRWRAHAVLGRPDSHWPRYRLEVDGSPALGDELRFTLQCWHDGHHRTALAPARWGGMLHALERHEVRSVLDISPAQVRALFGRRGEVSFARRVVDRVRRQVLGLDDRHADVWHRELYAAFGAEHQKVPARMDFTAIGRPWLREVAKEVTWIRMARQGVGPMSAHRTLTLLAHFERWAGARLDQGPAAIDRDLLDDYLVHVSGLPLSASEREARLVSLDGVLTISRAFGIESFDPTACYLHGEIHQRKVARKPRYYDQFVTAQLDDPATLARLTDPQVRIVYLAMRHGGLRIGSACSLSLDCLITDPGGQPWLRYTNHKGAQEDLIPISPKTAEEVRREQRSARERFPDTPWLLPGWRANLDGHKHVDQGQIRRHLARWVTDCDIRDQAGDPIELKPHRFRHTIATELLNRGMSKAAIKRFLSHKSEAMTSVYAHLHDQTLMAEWLATTDRVNSAGERVELLTPEITDEAAWLKHELGRAKQTLPDGECGLPIQQSCPHPNKCHSCPNFLTDERHRPVLQEQLARAEAKLARAEQAGHERAAEINRPDILDLRRILEGLDRLKADTTAPAPDPDFDLRASSREEAS
jgi:integrase